MSVEPISAPQTQPSLPKDAAPFAAQARHEVIKTAAYYLAERRGFAPGSELHDWLSAEAFIRSSFDTTQSAKRPLGSDRGAVASGGGKRVVDLPQ